MDAPSAPVTARLYNLRGRIVGMGQVDAGNRLLTLPIDNLASGIYMLKLDGTNFSETHKVVVVQ